MREHEDDSALFFTSSPYLIFGAGKYRQLGRIPTACYIDNYLDSMGETKTGLSLISFIKHYLHDKIIGLEYVKAPDRFFVPSPFLRDVYVKFGFPKDKFFIAPHFFDIPIHTQPVDEIKSMVS